MKNNPHQLKRQLPLTKARAIAIPLPLKIKMPTTRLSILLTSFLMLLLSLWVINILSSSIAKASDDAGCTEISNIVSLGTNIHTRLKDAYCKKQPKCNDQDDPKIVAETKAAEIEWEKTAKESYKQLNLAVDACYKSLPKHNATLMNLTNVSFLATKCSTFYSDSFLANQETKDFANIIAAQSLAKSISNGITAGMAAHQANTVGGLIQEPTPTVISETPTNTEDALVTNCQLNPSLPGCQQGIYGDNKSGGFYGDGIDISGAAGGTYIGAAGSADSDGSIGSGAIAGKGGSANSSKIGTVGGSSVGPYGNVGGGDFETRVDAAAVKSGGSGPSGSGSGSAPGGSASLGSAGNNAADAAANNKAGGSGVTSGAIAFKNGGVNFAPGSGGGGGRGKDGNGSENPFEKYFGKKDGAGNEDKTLNFRDLASQGKIGDQGTSIFKRLQDRYQSVYSQKRLIMYDTVDKK
ncbi:MAG: hypothetical protein HQK51_09240 [Oligoflexia bacterium]|nr:hypothetical protein [Oligoflexia bacterium]